MTTGSHGGKYEDVTPCSLVDMNQHSEEPAASVIRAEEQAACENEVVGVPVPSESSYWNYFIRRGQLIVQVNLLHNHTYRTVLIPVKILRRYT
jgi:hypothetical protein